MSFQRPGHELRFFKGISQEYVFLCCDSGLVEDYGSKYKDNPSLCELLHSFIRRATGDVSYADKMMRVIAKKLKCETKLLPDGVVK